jgi:glycosyltransferase involved in cell wall biosynthesis
MTNDKRIKVLMTGPENDPSISLGGIVTVVNMILKNSLHEIIYFNRDMGDKNKAATFFKKLFRFRQQVRKQRFNLIHFHFSFDRKSIIREALYVFIARQQKQPVVIHFHGGILLFRKKESKLIKWLLSAADRIIVLSEIEKESLANLYKVPADHILVLRNCIDLKEIPVFPQRKELQNNLVFFGRFHESKGIADILEACKTLQEQSVDFRFHAYGSGPGQQWFVSSMEEALNNKFSYKGLVWGEKKWHALQNTDIFLLPSRYGEGLPMALLEAMALGKVVIVSDDASITRVVQDNFNGLLVAKNAPAELARKIAWILSDTEAQKRIGHNASVTIRNEYSSDYYIKSLNTVYQSLLTN